MRAQLLERVIVSRRVVRAAQLASIALVAAACAVDGRGFDDDDVSMYGATNGGASSGVAGPSGAAGAGAPVAGSVSAAAGSQGAAVTPGSGNSGTGSGTSGTSTAAPAPSPPAAAAGGAGGSANAGSAGTSAGGGEAGGEMAGGAMGGTDPGAPPAAGPCALRLIVSTPSSFDDLLEVVGNDVRTFPVAERSFLRYITFTNRQNAGVPQCELDADTRLLLEILDRFVVDPTQRQVARITAGSMLVYRIDLRALGWDVGVALRGLQFINTWEAMVGLSAYATEFAGDNADSAVAAANTTVPVLFASALIEQVLDGVPPLPPQALAELQRDPELAAALNRISAPVEAADVAGDFGITTLAFSQVLTRLDPTFRNLTGGGFLDRAVYAPLFLPNLCILTEGQPAELVTCSR